MGNHKPPYRSPPPPAPMQREIPMTKTKLLVITGNTHMTEDQRTTFTAYVQGVADKVDAEVLVLPSHHHAQMIDMGESPTKAATDEVAPVEVADELKAGIFSGRFVPDSEQSAAMRTVAGLVDAGAIELIDDVYLPGGRVFRSLRLKDVGLSRRGM